jgi:hypothetical protein
MTGRVDAEFVGWCFAGRSERSDRFSGVFGVRTCACVAMLEEGCDGPASAAAKGAAGKGRGSVDADCDGDGLRFDWGVGVGVDCSFGGRGSDRFGVGDVGEPSTSTSTTSPPFTNNCRSALAGLALSCGPIVEPRPGVGLATGIVSVSCSSDFFLAAVFGEVVEPEPEPEREREPKPESRCPRAPSGGAASSTPSPSCS